MISEIENIVRKGNMVKVRKSFIQKNNCTESVLSSTIWSDY